MYSIFCAEGFPESGQVLNKIGCSFFSRYLPLYKEQKGKSQHIAEFNVWLNGYVSHDVYSWFYVKLYKRDSLHPSQKGTELLSIKFMGFLEKHLN